MELRAERGGLLCVTRQRHAVCTAGGVVVTLGSNTYVTGDSINQAQVTVTVQAGNGQLEARAADSSASARSHDRHRLRHRVTWRRQRLRRRQTLRSQPLRAWREQVTVLACVQGR